MDLREVDRLAKLYRLVLPRTSSGGPLGAVSASQPGSSLELHDFREYQPGDDLRHVDWNAVARTGKLYLRVRREDVAPRVELLVDASRSMAVTERKRERTREVAALMMRLCKAEGLPVAVFWLEDEARRIEGEPLERFEGARGLPELVSRTGLRPCGVRILVSDLLVEQPLGPTLRRLAEGAARLALVQVLDPEDEDPAGGLGARLVDAESEEYLDRLITQDVVERYLERFRAHQRALAAEARRVRALLCPVDAGVELEQAVRRGLASLVAPRGAARVA